MQNNELDGIWQQINNGGSTHPKARTQVSTVVHCRSSYSVLRSIP